MRCKISPEGTQLMNSTTNNPAPQLPALPVSPPDESLDERADPYLSEQPQAAARTRPQVAGADVEPMPLAEIEESPAKATEQGKPAAPASKAGEFVDPFPAFPAAPKKETRWCVWKYERKGEKLTKVPYQSVSVRASSTNPDTWLSYQQACTLDRKFHSDAKPTPEECVAGIGILCNGEDTFIDFDDCRNPTTGELEPWAEATVRDIGSYAEISPSGTGVHAFALGTVERSSKINGCEVYSRARYFTVTGNQVPGIPSEIKPYAGLQKLRDDIANDRLRPYKLADKRAKDSGDQPQEKADGQAKVNGGLRAIRYSPADFNALMRGEWEKGKRYPSQSEADLALCTLLAYKHNGDEEKIDQEFRESGLYRDKWERDGYRESTIKKAIESYERRKAEEQAYEQRPAGNQNTGTLKEVLRDMNERYVYVDENDLVIRLADAHLYKAENFRSGGHMANRFFVREITDESGNTRRKKIPLGKTWLEWPGRREVAAMVYEPGKDQVLADAINRWRGMGVAPVAGHIMPWKQLIEHLIPDPIARKWFEQWCAYPLQNLGAKLETAVVLWSVPQGTGKTTIYQTLRRIYGKNAEKISELDLQAQFNDWALDRQFIYADEISGGDKRKTSDVLKELITGSEIKVNQKFLPSITIRNCVQFLFSSNHPNAFYLEPSDRRFFVIEVASGLSKVFFDRYYTWLDNGGAAHLYAHLLGLPMVGFDPHGAPPMTADKQAMIDMGRSDVERWLNENRDFVAPASEWLNKFRNACSRFVSGRSNLTESGMLAALKRSGGHPKRITIKGEKLRLWSLDLSEQDSPLTWQERYQACHDADRVRQDRPKQPENTVLSDVGKTAEDCDTPF
jgi:primase-polymerase (primpol)-like protein